jgi:hypothetical protein
MNTAATLSKEVSVLSRAFTRENDDWVYCKKMMESCMFADEAGECPLVECKYTQEKKKEPPKAQEKDPVTYEKTIRIPF